MPDYPEVTQGLPEQLSAFFCPLLPASIESTWSVPESYATLLYAATIIRWARWLRARAYPVPVPLAPLDINARAARLSHLLHIMRLIRRREDRGTQASPGGQLQVDLPERSFA